MRLRIKNTKLTLQIIGWVQVAGGLTGLYLVAKLMLQTNDINGALLLIFMIGIFLFLYSIYCGKKLLIEPNKSFSIAYSIINYILQVLQWYLFGYGFTYSSGIELNVGAQKSEFTFNAGLTSDFAMSINTNDNYFLKINLFALLAVIVLFDVLEENRTISKEIKTQDDQIGTISISPTHL